MRTRLIRGFTIGMFAGMTTLACAALPPDLPTQFTFTLESRATNASAQKCGFTQFAPCCPGLVRYYRKQEIADNITVTFRDGNTVTGGGELNSHTVEKQVYSGGACVGVTNLLCSGDFSIWGGLDSATGTRTCATNCDGWTVVRSYAGVPWETNTCAQLDACYLHFLGECDQYGEFHAFWYPPAPTVCNLWSWVLDQGLWWDGYYYGQGVYRQTNTLSEEFTTPELIALLTNNLTGAFEPRGGESHHASAQISSDESAAWGTAVDARFKIFAPKDEKWEINYYGCRSWVSNNVPVTTKSEAKMAGVGTGGWVVTNIPLQAAFSTYATNGCTYYVGEEVWIEVGCGGSMGCTAQGCAATAGAVQAAVTDAGAVVQFGLGASSYGEGSGKLMWAASKPSANLTTLGALELFGDLRGSEVVQVGLGVRQVKGALTLADLRTNGATALVIRWFNAGYYAPLEDGGYEVAGLTPFATATLAQGSSTNQFVVTVQNGSTTQYVFDWSEAQQSWTLTSGGGLRRETIAWNAADLVRTNTIKNTAYEVVSQETKYYTDLANCGRLLTRAVVGAGGTALTRQWFYYDNAVTDGATYGQLKLVVDPTGFWRRYQYDSQGRLTNEVAQYLNAATNAPGSQCREVSYDYTSLDGTNDFETRIEKLLG